jgi:hypothetical protein
MRKPTGGGSGLLVPRSILILFLGLPATLWAQKGKDSWSNLNGLKAGQGIEVIESSMKHHDGEFVSVTDETLTLKKRAPTSW